MIHRLLAQVLMVLSQVADGAATAVADEAAEYVKTEVARLSQDLQAAISAGHIRASRDEVSISEKASPTKKAAKRTYLRLDALDAQGMAALCGGKLAPATAKPIDAEDTRTDEQKAPGACDYFNYGKDLDVRAKVRASLMTEMEGPEKAIAKAVTNLVQNAGMSETEAREFVVAQRTKAGLAV